MQNRRRTPAEQLARVASWLRKSGGEPRKAWPPLESVDWQPPLSHRFSFRLQNGHYANSPVAGQTLTTLLHLEAPPRWVRLMFFNDQDHPWTIDGAALAVSGAVGDGHTPINADGVTDLSLWERVSFNNNGLDVDPLIQAAGEVYALTVPALPKDAIARSSRFPTGCRSYHLLATTAGSGVYCWSGAIRTSFCAFPQAARRIAQFGGCMPGSALTAI